jgi:hypothetical protein
MWRNAVRCKSIDVSEERIVTNWKVAGLMNVGFRSGHCIYLTLTPLTIFDYNLWWRSRQFTQSQSTVYIALSLFHSYSPQSTITRTESSWSAVSHQFSGTGFLRFRTVPVSQPQRPSQYSGAPSGDGFLGALSNNCFKWASVQCLLHWRSNSSPIPAFSRPVTVLSRAWRFWIVKGIDWTLTDRNYERH